MRDAGRITGEALLKARDAVKPGVSTYELDKIIHDYIIACKAVLSFSICAFRAKIRRHC